MILGDDPDDILPTDKQLKQMTFLNYCIKETMRINPPTSGNLPRMTSRVILIGNFLIPKDTIVHLVNHTPLSDAYLLTTCHRNCIAHIIWKNIGIDRKNLSLKDSIQQARTIGKMQYGCPLVMVLEHASALISVYLNNVCSWP